MLQHKRIIQLVISGALAWGFIQFYLKEKEGAIANAYGMVEVLVASRDIPPRTELTAPYITTQKFPLKYVAPGAIVIKIPSDAMARVKGKVTVTATQEGTQIVQANLMNPSIKDTGVAPLIPPGKRGYILRLGNLDVANLLLPGDYIDIMATFTVRRDNVTSKLTNTILQNVMVISVGKVLKKAGEDVTGKSKDSGESLMLTLALFPEEAQAMALAQAESQGEISVVVRPHGDSVVRNVPIITPAQLLGVPPPPQASKPQPRPSPQKRAK